MPNNSISYLLHHMVCIFAYSTSGKQDFIKKFEGSSVKYRFRTPMFKLSINQSLIDHFTIEIMSILKKKKISTRKVRLPSEINIMLQLFNRNRAVYRQKLHTHANQRSNLSGVDLTKLVHFCMFLTHGRNKGPGIFNFPPSRHHQVV